MAGELGAPVQSGRREQRLAVLAVVSAVLMWGYSPVAIKSISTSGLVTAFYRLWFAIPFLWLGVLATPRMRRGLSRDWLLGSVLGGTAFGLHQLCFFYALNLTTIANVTIIGSLQPVLILLVAAPLFGESTTLRSLLMSLVALAGTGLVVFGSVDEAQAGGLGDVLAVGNLLAFTAYFLISKRVRQAVGTTEYVVGMTTTSGLVIAFANLASGQDLASPSSLDLVVIASLAVFPGTLGHVLTNWAHAHTTALRISMIMLAAPVVATASAAVFLDEPVTLLQALGFLVVLSSIAVVVAGTGGDTPEELAESAARTDAP